MAAMVRRRSGFSDNLDLLLLVAHLFLLPYRLLQEHASYRK